ncbi:hypothetical protein WJX74_004948 [Apatococcus lobatus]|uniref:Exosome complex component CSL4 n=1 Tax=Apatococcus lobatus TaxID=904363 RepID=A0AAW1QJ10_9CHLO
MASTRCVCPGDRLGASADFVAGPGVYNHSQHLLAESLGFVQIVQPGVAASDQRPSISVSRRIASSALPKPGDKVTCKVLKTNPRLALVNIVCVGPKVLEEAFSGVIRRTDVRATEIDKVEIYSSFRPGDIVIAEVVSLGDARSYYLSTAKNDLGVVYAKSVAGEVMVATGWETMICPVTKSVEKRKVAKK